MDDRLHSRCAELEAEAKRLGIDVETLAAQFKHMLGRRFDVPMTMRAQR
jgi:hypothetical protein